MTQVATHHRELIFSPAIRIFHWIRALSIVVLIATGFYISWPFLVAPESSDVLVQGWIRFAHVIFGFALTSVTIVRFYLFFFGRSSIERRSVKDVLSINSWITQIKSYIWMGHLNKAGVYGPLQFVTYVGISLAALFMCITGLVLYANVYHEGFGGLIWEISAWFTALMGGLAQVRIWHHIITWAFIAFMVIHVYMAVWSGIRFKHNSVDSIVSGYDYHKDH
ncbi:Ni/Fe-hydrogenase, b-type cytochrome subunit [Shewanella sp. 1_MG-2023]|uniref:Ni/Fe-hydrogenase, b-type cytochrome subunit n=1 Tax=unclassified Shewanella TaxID=196818 RepID=UPI0026E3B355|nr:MULTISPECIES: Ni/Fe-hydrogenase, b-type cytochrome subunit [unclassified Shewanella]MDO6612879.1 Ni/Fe-hydrogenase, b-type cytochrome subunit [Shewanella sp. 7_MG-2023]MDO6772591.1 Ni/Fe-hydrogenase, b-type cytochrome subunit [Shewanella sp. 2_MG-2023]MDO6795205.1 Ni/Fe-hydrogenase, b-type cytochrome subunit [Shewanella sp. 1_MG-2023]